MVTTLTSTPIGSVLDGALDADLGCGLESVVNLGYMLRQGWRLLQKHRIGWRFDLGRLGLSASTFPRRALLGPRDLGLEVVHILYGDGRIPALLDKLPHLFRPQSRLECLAHFLHGLGRQLAQTRVATRIGRCLMTTVSVGHHSQDPRASVCLLSARLPLAIHQATSPVFAYASFLGQIPVVDISPAAITPYIGNTPLVIVGGSNAGVAVTAGMLLAVLHDILKRIELTLGRRRHAIIWVRVGIFIVFRTTGRRSWIELVLLEVVHGEGLSDKRRDAEG